MKKNIYSKKKNEIPQINMPQNLEELEAIIYAFLQKQHDEATANFSNYTEQRRKVLEPIAELVGRLNASHELLMSKREQIEKELAQIEENSIAKTMVLNKDTTDAAELEKKLDAAILKKHKLKLLLEACEDNKTTNITLEQRKELGDVARAYRNISLPYQPDYRYEMSNFLDALSRRIKFDFNYRKPEPTFGESESLGEKILFQLNLLQHIAEPKTITLVNKLQQRDKNLVRQIFDEWIFSPTTNFEERVIEVAAKHNIKQSEY